jgi:hypothetical protein
MSYAGCPIRTPVRTALVRRRSNTLREARQRASGLLSCWDDDRETQILGMGA